MGLLCHILRWIRAWSFQVKGMFVVCNATSTAHYVGLSIPIITKLESVNPTIEQLGIWWCTLSFSTNLLALILLTHQQCMYFRFILCTFVNH